MSLRAFRTFSIVLAIALIAACGGDSKGITQPAGLTDAQFASMSGALSQVLVRAFEENMFSGSLSRFDARASTPRVGADQAPYNATALCLWGGQAALHGTSDSESGSDVHFVFAETLAQCVSKGADGKSWQFNTDSALATIIDFHTDGEVSATTQTDVGTVLYSSDRQTGSCEIDLSILDSIATGEQGVRVHAHGTACGLSVSIDSTLTLSRARNVTHPI